MKIVFFSAEAPSHFRVEAAISTTLNHSDLLVQMEGVGSNSSICLSKLSGQFLTCANWHRWDVMEMGLSAGRSSDALTSRRLGEVDDVCFDF